MVNQTLNIILMIKGIKFTSWNQTIEEVYEQKLKTSSKKYYNMMIFLIG